MSYSENRPDTLSHPKETIVLDREGNPLFSDANRTHRQYEGRRTYSTLGGARIVKLGPWAGALGFLIVLCALAFGSVFFAAFLVLAVSGWVLRRVLSLFSIRAK